MPNHVSREPGEVILLGHGDGGRLTRQLIDGIFIPRFGNPILDHRDDSGLIPLNDLLSLALVSDGPSRPRAPENLDLTLAFTTDSFVVHPLFFPGGDIGKLAVCGTVNDLTVCGAKPLYLTASLILEEGFDIETLEKIADSMAAAARDAGVRIVTGDTKVVERGHGDGVFINTAGIGIKSARTLLGADRLKPGDAVLISGDIGDHGATIMVNRHDLDIGEGLASDCAALNEMIPQLLEECGDAVKWMRDPTRGGVATCVAELASAAGVDILLFEDRLPINPRVRGTCELLGLDPLYLANEGKAVIVVERAEAERAVSVLKRTKPGQNAAIVGEVKEGTSKAAVRTKIGGTKRLDLFAGQPLPRIC